MKRHDDTIAIYSRKSRFTGKGESIGNQVELCRAYIREHFGSSDAVRAAVFEDEGFSGGNLNRPAFQKMMEKAHRTGFKAIIVYRLDRISRNIGDFSGLIEELARLEIDFISIREQFDTNSPMGRAMMYISSVFSQLERETIAERIRDNMHELAKTGRWLGGTTPTGYTSESVRTVSVDGKSRKACKLALLPEEAATVRKIYDLYAEYDSLTQVEAELLRQRVRTKTGRDYTRFAIKGILQNPVYLIADADAYRYFLDRRSDLFAEPSDFDGVRGILAYNRTDQEKGKSTRYLPMEDWIVTVGQHPGIIPAKAWIGVQSSLARNREKGYRKPRNNEALLTGLLFCRCGARMYPKLSKRNTAEGTQVYTYVCKMKERSRRERCNNNNVRGNELDLALIKQIKLLQEDCGEFASLLKKGRRFAAGNLDGYRARLEHLKKERMENEKRIAGLVNSMAELRESSARTRVAQRIEELNTAANQLDIQIAELEAMGCRQPPSEIEFDRKCRQLASFPDCIDAMSVEQKRGLLRAMIRRIVCDGGQVHVFLSGTEGDSRCPDTLLREDSK